MNVEVILREDFPSLGYVGDKVSVRAGYARNFLLPRGVAVEAFSHNQRQMQHQMAGIMSRRARLKAQAEELGRRLEATELAFTVKVGSQGKLFGSITAKDIEAQLREKGFAVDRKQIKITDQLKKSGSYKVQVKLHAEVTVNVTVKIESDGPVQRKEASEAVAASGSEASSKQVDGAADGASPKKEKRSPRKKKEAAPSGEGSTKEA
jgi:large subunit ribosomal protein L9